jgi:hypothetical protein
MFEIELVGSMFVARRHKAIADWWQLIACGS